MQQSQKKTGCFSKNSTKSWMTRLWNFAPVAEKNGLTCNCDRAFALAAGTEKRRKNLKIPSFSLLKTTSTLGMYRTFYHP